MKLKSFFIFSLVFCILFSSIPMNKASAISYSIDFDINSKSLLWSKVLARIILIPATFKAGLPCCLPTGNLFGLCVGPMQGARSPDGRSWRSGQFGRSFCSQGPVMKDISEGFRGKPLICSLLGS